MALEEWQRGLRRQFGRAQAFKWKNLGPAPIFSEFAVENPQRSSRYRRLERKHGELISQWLQIFLAQRLPGVPVVDRSSAPGPESWCMRAALCGVPRSRCAR
ncbi:MAG: hypothetical protein ACREUT_09750 [Steroidobacteraceae bacterium]